jgi:hypothetical protein
MVGEIVHIELPSRDFARSAIFYAKLFGWKTDGIQSGGHLPLELPGGVQGSLIRDALAQAPGPVPFVAVNDVDKVLAEAEKQGGNILVQRMTLPGRGSIGLLADCDGNVVGVLAAKGLLAGRPVETAEHRKDDASKEAPPVGLAGKPSRELKSKASPKPAANAGTRIPPKKAPPRKR